MKKYIELVPNNLKSDDSFLSKLAIGASGTNATISKMREFKFNPIELERGSTGFKLWKKIKIKRVRVPDILCLNTGVRCESRGKTKVEISMSHSLKDPKRAWDAGMRDDDFVSIVVFKQNEESPVDVQRISPVHFIGVSDLRTAFEANQVAITTPKGFEEGSEIRVIWTCASANSVSEVSEISATSLYLTPDAGGRRQRISLSRASGRIALTPQVAVGDRVEANQIVASVVPIAINVTPPANVAEEYFVEKLGSFNLSERYAAAKALRFRGSSVDSIDTLRAHMSDPDEDIYVQLEAAAALAAYGVAEGWEFMRGKLQQIPDNIPLETQLETIIVASEIRERESEELLINVLQNTEKHEELRAGAAWGLGGFASETSASALVDTFNLSSIEIKVDAARALLKIARPQTEHLVNLLRGVDPAKRDGIAWTLAKSGGFEAANLLPAGDDNFRRWLGYILGKGKHHFSEADLEAICCSDPEVYFAASVLWQVVESWVDDLREY